MKKRHTSLFIIAILLLGAGVVTAQNPQQQRSGPPQGGQQAPKVGYGKVSGKILDENTEPVP